MLHKQVRKLRNDEFFAHVRQVQPVESYEERNSPTGLARQQAAQRRDDAEYDAWQDHRAAQH